GQLRELVGEDEALSAVETAFRALAEGRAVQPPPMGLDLDEVRGEVHVKGAYLHGEPVFAIKCASGFYNNAELGLPVGAGLVLVFDATTGFPLALLQDNAYLTEIRTGGAGALAVRLLAPERPLKTAVIGAGSQARYQLRAIRRVREIQELRAWSPIPEELASYVQEMGSTLGVPVSGAGTPGDAVQGADLVVTVTPAREPLLELGWLAKGATVVAVGSDGPEKQELAPEILAPPAKVVVDSRAQCLGLGETHHAVKAGVLRTEDIHGELGEVLLGLRPGREGDELIVCDLTGVGAQDAAMAGVVWGLLG
ncbi:MAG: ornithine cyclodeaminase family protein, partial [Gemmatimonadetes bacterium]|nr:ornithine cyclodeaminase family protein [Gemmatimonadota bacterium]